MELIILNNENLKYVYITVFLLGLLLIAAGLIFSDLIMLAIMGLFVVVSVSFAALTTKKEPSKEENATNIIE